MGNDNSKDFTELDVTHTSEVLEDVLGELKQLHERSRSTDNLNYKYRSETNLNLYEQDSSLPSPTRRSAKDTTAPVVRQKKTRDNLLGDVPSAETCAKSKITLRGQQGVKVVQQYIKKIQQEFRVLSEEARVLREQAADQDRLLQGREHEVRQLRDELAALKDQLAGLSNVSNDLKTHTETIEFYKQQVYEYKELYEKETSRMQTVITQNKRELEDCQRKLHEAKESARALTESYERKLQTATRESTEVTELKRTLMEERSRVTLVERRLEEESRRLQRKLTENEETIESLTRQLEQAQKEKCNHMLVDNRRPYRTRAIGSFKKNSTLHVVENDQSSSPERRRGRESSDVATDLGSTRSLETATKRVQESSRVIRSSQTSGREVYKSYNTLASASPNPYPKY